MAKENKKEAGSNDCFIIMPMSDPDGYDKGHFRMVYEDIFKIACNMAGFNPVRADEVEQTNLIHLDLLQKLVDSPMVMCDLSSRNPNVLFELGLRQAFDKPTVLVQEKDTPKIFDTSVMRITEYGRELRYAEVLKDQRKIAKSLTATKKATDEGDGVNSIVSLLSLSSPASLREVKDNDAAKMLQVVMSEMTDLRADFRQIGTTISRAHTALDMDEEEILMGQIKDAYKKLISTIRYNSFHSQIWVPGQLKDLMINISKGSAIVLSSANLEQVNTMINETAGILSTYLASLMQKTRKPLTGS